MATSRKTHTFHTKKFLTVIIPLLVVAVVAIAFIVLRIQQDRSEREATIVAREALVQALTTDLVVAAPVEARTGDVYFPALRLYLPAAQQRDSLDSYTYQIDAYGDEHPADSPVINISTRRTVSAAAGDLYNAQNSVDLFERVPHAQSCARGISVALSPIEQLRQDDDQMARKFHHKQTLSDGRELYFYYEPACSEIVGVIDELAALQPYER